MVDEGQQVLQTIIVAHLSQHIIHLFSLQGTDDSKVPSSHRLQAPFAALFAADENNHAKELEGRNHEKVGTGKE